MQSFFSGIKKILIFLIIARRSQDKLEMVYLLTANSGDRPIEKPSKMSGKVYIVGAGVGGEGYLSLKAKEAIAVAEVIIYDALVDDRLLQLAPSDCLKIDVGKRGGVKNTPQTKINQLLIAYCLQGKKVIRLKSGDPGVFGRIWPEISALEREACAFELIPGISSAIAAPLLAGIPLTEKDLSRCFAVFSGHQPDLLDWEALTKIDTLVILMGTRNLSKIVDRLLLQGKLASTPVAIIRNCGLGDREVFFGTLTDIVDRTADLNLSPAVIMIGEVVKLGQNLQMNLPLANKTILVTRSASQSAKFTELLQDRGARAIEMPALIITPPSSWQDLDRAIADLSSFDWLILTSANAVEYFCDRLDDLGKDTRSLAGIKIAVVGKKTAVTLKKYSLNPDFIPPNFVADSLVEHFPPPVKGQKILFPRVETGGREVLVRELTSVGAIVTEVAAYESKCPDRIPEQAKKALETGKIDIVTFASSKTVQNFNTLLKSLENSQSLAEKLAIASIGPQTSQKCLELFGRVDIEAREYTLEGLTKAIVAAIAVN